MKIALVHDWLNGFAGGEQVVLALHELYPEAPIYTSVFNAARTPQFASARVIPSYLQKLPALRRSHQLAIPLMPQAFESFDLKGFDVVVSIGGGLSKGVITEAGQRHISYCTTPMRYLWHIGGDDRASGSPLRSYIAHRLRVWDLASSFRVDDYVAVSHTVAARIKKIFRRDAAVIYPPVDTNRFGLAAGPPGDYFLSVGRLIGYKKIDLLIKACKITRSPLKIVGEGPLEARLRQLASGAPWIELLGRVSDTQLRTLYQGARAFLFAAEEDFGIVPVEAMSAGRPVIAYGKGGATETIKDGRTGLFFADQTAESLAGAITGFRDDIWDAPAIRGHAEGFDTKIFKCRMRGLIEGGDSA